MRPMFPQMEGREARGRRRGGTRASYQVPPAIVWRGRLPMIAVIFEFTAEPARRQPSHRRAAGAGRGRSPPAAAAFFSSDATPPGRSRGFEPPRRRPPTHYGGRAPLPEKEKVIPPGPLDPPRL